MDIGFSKSLNVATLYVKYAKSSGSDMLIVLIYVGDILIIGNKEAEVEDIKGRMRSVFEMSDLGKMAYFLGMEVHQWEQGIFNHQRKFGEELSTKFFMENSNAVCTPFAVGEELVKDDGTFYYFR